MAHARFAGQVKAGRVPLDDPAALHPDGTPDDDRIPYPASDPERAATALDHWLARHAEPTDPWAGDAHAVSGHLPRHSTTAMLMLVDRVSHRLLAEQPVPDPRAQAAVAERRALLYRRLIAEGDAPAEAARWAETEEARARALRATPGTDTPSTAIDEQTAGGPEPEQ